MNPEWCGGGEKASAAGRQGEPAAVKRGKGATGVRPCP